MVAEKKRASRGKITFFIGFISVISVLNSINE